MWTVGIGLTWQARQDNPDLTVAVRQLSQNLIGRLHQVIPDLTVRVSEDFTGSVRQVSPDLTGRLHQVSPDLTSGLCL